jgi:hypothetical protein
VVFLEGRFGRERVVAMVRATLDGAFEAWVGGL